MALVLVPLLEEPAAGRVPEGKLGSKADFIKLVWHFQKGNFQGFQGNVSKVKKYHLSRTSLKKIAH